MLPRTLNYDGTLIGVAGIATVVLVLEEVGAVFGLGLIVWFVLVGLALPRGGADIATERSQRGDAVANDTLISA